MYGDAIPRVVVIDPSLLAAPEGFERTAWALGQALRKHPVRVFVPMLSELGDDPLQRADRFAHLADDASLGGRIPRESNSELAAGVLMVHCSRQGIPMSLRPLGADVQATIHPGSGITPIEGSIDRALLEANEWAKTHGNSRVELWCQGKAQARTQVIGTTLPRIRQLDEEESALIRS